jgi:hypothetical protein
MKEIKKLDELKEGDYIKLEKNFIKLDGSCDKVILTRVIKKENSGSIYTKDGHLYYEGDTLMYAYPIGKIGRRRRLPIFYDVSKITKLTKDEYMAENI